MRVAIFDLDGTLIDSHIWYALMRSNFKKKINRFYTLFYILTHFFLIPFWKLKIIPEKNYFSLWGKHISWMVKGLPLKEARKIFASLWKNDLSRSLKEKTLKRLKEHLQRDDKIILVSGSFEELLKVVKKKLNAHYVIGTKLEERKGILTGKIIPPLCFSEGKLERLREFLKEKKLKIDFKKSFAYCDSIYDIFILNLVGNPVVVDPDKKLFEIAKKRKWEIL